MSSPSTLKANGARLIRLIVDVGTETLRKYFDSIHPPANLPAVLNTNREKLNKLRGRIIKEAQWTLLFPPAGRPPTTSKNYDITLLFILLRNICGLSAPATADGGISWDQNPPQADQSPAADLVRVKLYRNTVFAHIKSTEVSDGDFNRYWSEISRVLERLRRAVGEDIRNTITYLKISNLDDGTDWAQLFFNWFENDARLGNFMQKNQQLIETNQKYLKWIMCIVFVTLAVLLYGIYDN